MIEKNIVDRVSTYPGRVRLIETGQPNIFDTERADEPTNPGTPIDKALFESIIKSRLTGRYYMPNVMQEVISQADASCAAYGVNSFYNNRFIQNDGFPVEFSDGQRVTIITSAEVTTMGVKSNTLNGIEIYRILKPLTRYELIYCVDHFEVVEG